MWEGGIKLGDKLDAHIELDLNLIALKYIFLSEITKNHMCFAALSQVRTRQGYGGASQLEGNLHLPLAC